MDSITLDPNPSGDGDPVGRTVRWYNCNAEEYAEWTREIDLSSLRNRFLRHVSEGGRILDVGCGAGRDAKAFLDQGYETVAFDASEELARLAAEHTGQKVHQCKVQEFEPEGRFDGIWACASLLHVPEAELPAVFDSIASWLRPGGTLYASFTTGERQDPERFFNRITEEDLAALLEQTEGLSTVEVWISGDAGGREQVEWTNTIAERLPQ